MTLHSLLQNEPPRKIFISVEVKNSGKGMKKTYDEIQQYIRKIKKKMNKSYYKKTYE